MNNITENEAAPFPAKYEFLFFCRTMGRSANSPFGFPPLWILQQCAHFVHPCVDCGLGCDELGAAGGIKAEFPFLCKRGTTTDGAHIAQDGARPTAVCHERDNRFAVPAVAVQKCLYGWGHRIPPCGCANGDDVIVLHIVCLLYTSPSPRDS